MMSTVEKIRKLLKNGDELLRGFNKIQWINTRKNHVFKFKKGKYEKKSPEMRMNMLLFSWGRSK